MFRLIVACTEARYLPISVQMRSVERSSTHSWFREDSGGLVVERVLSAPPPPPKLFMFRTYQNKSTIAGGLHYVGRFKRQSRTVCITSKDAGVNIIVWSFHGSDQLRTPEANLPEAQSLTYAENISK